MKQILLMIAVVALVGCGKKEPAQPSVSNSTTSSGFEETKAKAEAGNVDAQYNLGEMYRKGEGVEQDFKEVVKWYQKAAGQGNAPAQSNLGVMYYNGKGVPQDYMTAYVWYNIAAAKGDQDAKNTKSEVAKKMTPAQIAKAGELVKEMIKKNPKLLK